MVARGHLPSEGAFAQMAIIEPAASFHWLMRCNLDALQCGTSGDFVFALYLYNGIFQWNVFDVHTP